MTAAHPLDRLSTTTRVLQRAQYEALRFSLCPDGTVVVRNESYAEPAEHEYRVTVRDGLPVHCVCPADEQYDFACKHRVALAVRRPILEAATTVQAVAEASTSESIRSSRSST